MISFQPINTMMLPQVDRLLQLGCCHFIYQACMELCDPAIQYHAFLTGDILYRVE